MSYELYFKSGWSNKDAGLKRSQRSWEIHCHKKATWLCLWHRRLFTASWHSGPSWNTFNETILLLTPEILSSLPSLRSLNLSAPFLPPRLESCHRLFPLLRVPFFFFFGFTNWDDTIRDCHRHASLVLIDKTISNPSEPPPPLSLTHSSQRRSTRTGSISRFFEASVPESEFIWLNFWKEKMESDESGVFFHWCATVGVCVCLFYVCVCVCAITQQQHLNANERPFVT